MPRPQFILRALLVAMLVVAAFLGGIHFERERQKRGEKAVLEQAVVEIERLGIPEADDEPLLSLPSQEDWDRMTKRRKVR